MFDIILFKRNRATCVPVCIQYTMLLRIKYEYCLICYCFRFFYIIKLLILFYFQFFFFVNSYIFFRRYILNRRNKVASPAICDLIIFKMLNTFNYFVHQQLVVLVSFLFFLFRVFLQHFSHFLFLCRCFYVQCPHHFFRQFCIPLFDV